MGRIIAVDSVGTYEQHQERCHKYVRQGGALLSYEQTLRGPTWHHASLYEMPPHWLGEEADYAAQG